MSEEEIASQQKPCRCCDEDKSFYETEGYCFNTDHAPAMAEHLALVRERDQLRAQVEELAEALRWVKDWFGKLEDGVPASDPLRAVRRKYHAPVHAKIDAALANAEVPRAE